MNEQDLLSRESEYRDRRREYRPRPTVDPDAIASAIVARIPAPPRPTLDTDALAAAIVARLPAPPEAPDTNAIADAIVARLPSPDLFAAEVAKRLPAPIVIIPQPRRWWQFWRTK